MILSCASVRLSLVFQLFHSKSIPFIQGLKINHELNYGHINLTEPIEKMARPLSEIIHSSFTTLQLTGTCWAINLLFSFVPKYYNLHKVIVTASQFFAKLLHKPLTFPYPFNWNAHSQLIFGRKTGQNNSNGFHLQSSLSKAFNTNDILSPDTLECFK